MSQDFQVEAMVDAPLAAVYAVYRDGLDQVAIDVEHIERIELCDPVPGPGILRLRHRWYVRLAIPALARPYVPPEMLRWDAEVVWRDRDTACDFVIRTPRFTERVHCSGRVELATNGGGTRVVMHGSLGVQLDGLPFVPARLQARLGRRIEAWVLARVPASFLGVAARVDARLREVPWRAAAPR